MKTYNNFQKTITKVCTKTNFNKSLFAIFSLVGYYGFAYWLPDSHLPYVGCLVREICDMTPEAIANSIVKLYKDKNLYAHICQCLESKKDGNVKEIEKYFKALGD